MIPKEISNLVRSGHAAPSADNSQPWRFLWDGETLRVGYDTDRVQGLTFPPASPATLLSVGGVLENITQAAEFASLSLKVEFPIDAIDTNGFYATIYISDTERQNRDIKQHPLFLRHTNRFKFKKEPIQSDKINTLSKLSEGSARITVLSHRAAIKQTASLVLQASKVRFQTQELHEWLRKSFRFTEKSVKKADGLDVRTLDLPPGGGFFLRFISDWNKMKTLNKFGLYKLLALIDSHPVELAPAIVSVIAPPSSSASIDAGRLLSRAWIHLNSVGIAVHPYYVVSDQLERLSKNLVPVQFVGQIEAMKSRGENLFELESGETLHMLLRIGYPTREPPRSLRLPLEKVLTVS